MGKASTHDRPDPIYLGWRHIVPGPPPGPPPKRPAPGDYLAVSDDWLTRQRRVETEINRPLLLFIAAICGIALLLVLLATVRILPWLFTVVGMLGCLVAVFPLALGLWQGRQVTRERIAEEERRIAEERAEGERRLRERQAEHARLYTEWEARKRAFAARPRWYAVTVPPESGRIDVLGGSGTGWSAAVTTIATGRLRAGGDITVVDLSGRAVASDLVALARSCGVSSRVWVLPADLPHLDLGTNLGVDALADLLSSVAAVRDTARDPAADAARDPAADAALIKQVLDVVGADARVAEVTDGLRALAEGEEGGGSTLAAGLARERRSTLRTRLGTTPEIREHAWQLQARLAALENVATRGGDAPFAQVKVIALDRTSGADAGRLYGTYTVAALRHLVRRLGGEATARRAWTHTVMVCGADLVDAREREELASAARRAGVGLVLFHHRVRDSEFVRGADDEHRHTAVMRAEDPDTARALAAFLARQGRGQPAAQRLTEVIGAALDGEMTDAYGRENEAADAAVPRLRKAVAPLDLVRRLGATTAWGRVTQQAAQIAEPGEDGAAPTGAPVRLDEHGIGELPHTALLLMGGDGLDLVDCNPGILGLPTATLATTPEPTPAPTPLDPDAIEVDANLGPPEQRLDWRRS